MPILQLKITMKDTSKPNVYRTVLIDSKSNFDDLHTLIQNVFYLYGCHMHRFEIFYGMFGQAMLGKLFQNKLIANACSKTTHDKGIFTIQETQEEYEIIGDCQPSETNLDQIFIEPKNWINYLYDFGDSWEFRVELQKILDKTEYELPHCIKAQGLCPIEDCGGIWGYCDMIEMLQSNKKLTGEKKEIFEWMQEFVGLEGKATKAEVMQEWEAVSSLKECNRQIHGGDDE
jgi:Plasmid pRiA4b ORF-3-like protein